MNAKPPTDEQLAQAIATVDTALTAPRRAARRDAADARALRGLFVVTPLPWVALLALGVTPARLVVPALVVLGIGIGWAIGSALDTRRRGGQ
ncbi:MAG: hypothetical protein ACRDQY_01730 [Pseudonocardiaceae bacterium]